MSAPRVIQNFRNCRALLWCAQGHDAQTLLAAIDPPMRKLGVSLARIETIDVAGLDHNRDILLVDADGDLDAVQVLYEDATVPPLPIVGLVGVEAPSRLKALVDLGVTSFLRKPVHGSAVYASLFLAVNGHQRLRAMAERIAEHDRRRRGRRFIIKAVVQLVQTQGLTDDEAYALLRHESMRARQGIEEYCEAMIEARMAANVTSMELDQENMNEKRIAQDGGAVGVSDTADGGPGRRPDQARRPGRSVG